MRKLYSLLLLLFTVSQLWSQKNGSVRGVAFDTSSKQPVSAATITILDKKDSSLVTFTMTDNTGHFSLKGLANGEYRALVTHISYRNSNILFHISDSSKNADLGNIIMNDVNKVLEEVVVNNEGPPVTLINDTIQYNAGSFKTQPNASVEQLLKRLPGIKVEKDGTIKAQGEKVERVLVDGKEFFGNDPKIATKNLPADAIDKVQVYDKQSDQAQLTGFEDGNYEKTINLKLKKDKKKGLFGKATAGGGTDNRYEGRFNLNSFKGARQISAIGMGNNDNAEGFTFFDILNFTGELGRMQKGSSGGNININVSANDQSGLGLGGNNGGINTVWAGGVNYNDIIGTKLDLQSNYFYNQSNPYSEKHTQRQYFLPDSSYYDSQDMVSDNFTSNHRVNLNGLYQIDSMSSLRINPSFSYQQNRNKSQTNYQTMAGNKNLTNQGFSDNTANTSGYNLRNDMIYRRKFARKGRTFSLSLQTSLNESSGDGSLSSITQFYNPNGSMLPSDTINQTNTNSADLRGYNTRAVYTEPIFKRSLLEFSAGQSDTKSTAQKTTFDYNKLNGKHDIPNAQLSNDFENSYSFTNAGFRLRNQRRKYNYAVGLSWQRAELSGKIISDTKDSLISKRFFNLLPNARFQYNFSKFKTLAISYNASTNQPSMSQLQPVPDNSNPLNIRQGNPALKQEMAHNIMGHISLVSPYKNKNLFGFFAIQLTQNKIVDFDSVNQLGIKYTKPVNVNGVYNINTNLSYSMPLHFLKGNIELGSNSGYFNGKQFIDSVENGIKTLTLGPDLRLDINPNDKLNITLGAGVNYTRTSYSLSHVLNTSYISQEFNSSVDWQLPKRFFFSTDFTYTINSQRSAGFNTKVPIWNASISKQCLHYNRGEFKLSARDLLNRNVGISRSTNQNYIEDSRVITLQRFFSLSFTYSLSKTGLNNQGGGGMMRIISK